MALYVVILDSENGDVWNRIREEWPADHHIFDSRVALIRAKNELTSSISKKVGISSGGANGFVVQMDYFAGYTKTSLVEWISKYHD